MARDLATIVAAFVIGSALAGALGGRPAAEQLLAAEDPKLDTSALVAALERHAGDR